jgi:hypothetical protein
MDGIWLEVLRKTTETLREDSGCPSRDSKRASPAMLAYSICSPNTNASITTHNWNWIKLAEESVASSMRAESQE